MMSLDTTSHVRLTERFDDSRPTVAGRPLDDLAREFAENGYLKLDRVVDEAPLLALGKELAHAFELAKERGELLEGGGAISGHLNCFPGASSSFVLDALANRGVLRLMSALSPKPLRQPNVGCNFNLPGSSRQNEHIDGYAADPFLVLNVAVVDTTLENGAMEILSRTHRRQYKYWEIMFERPERLRLCMRPGDVLIRTSALWHRGMPNRSASARPMLAFTWEDGGSRLPDPYAVHGGRITFLPNRYHTDWKGRLRERAFVKAPRLGTAVRIVQSMFER